MIEWCVCTRVVCVGVGANGQTGKRANGQKHDNARGGQSRKTGAGRAGREQTVEKGQEDRDDEEHVVEQVLPDEEGDGRDGLRHHRQVVVLVQVPA